MVRAGQLDAGGAPELTPQAIPALAEKQVIEIKPSNKRTNKARLLPKGSAERKLRKLGELGISALYIGYPYEIAQEKVTSSQKICGHIVN